MAHAALLLILLPSFLVCVHAENTTEVYVQKEYPNVFEGHPTDWCCSCCGVVLNCNRELGNVSVAKEAEDISKFKVTTIPVQNVGMEGSPFICCCCCGQCLTCTQVHGGNGA